MRKEVNRYKTGNSVKKTIKTVIIVSIRSMKQFGLDMMR